MHRLLPPPIQRLANSGARHEVVEGTALVIDAEGSTALSARLLPYGTEGAEAFADILAAIFSPIVENVTAEGAFIAEFAGDGILAVFPGDPAVTVGSAVRSAVRVMRDLSSMSEISTPDGPASLTVRAVVGAGSFEWTIWTAENPEAQQNAAYACLGSAVAEALRGEPITPGGVVSLGPSAASYLSADTVRTDLSDGFVSITGIGTEQDGPYQVAPNPAHSHTDLRFYPTSVVESELRGEFRDVVSVFVEFGGPHAARDKSAIERTLAALATRRGYLSHVSQSGVNSDGTRVMALWGAPTSREHDVGYALRFLEDVRIGSGYDNTRAGVTRSTAFTGFIGSPRQELYTAIGPGVNLAARICNGAGWGEIRVDEHVAATLEDPWQLDEVGELGYRGFSRPIGTYRVTNIPPVLMADPFEGALIGRGGELDELEDLLAPMWVGRKAGIIAVAGEPGVGKSHLINALEARLLTRSPKPVWIRGQADEIRTQPLATLKDALTGYFGRPGQHESGERLDEYLAKLPASGLDSTDEIARTRTALGDLLQLAPDVEKAEHLDPKTRFDNLVLAVENLLLAIEKTNPVIVSVADGQWIDGGTAEVLVRLSERLKDRSVAFIIETRDTNDGLPSDHVVDVGPLGGAEMAKLAEHFIGEEPTPDLVSALTERSGGNPYFARQLLEFFRRDELLGSAVEILRASGPGTDVPLDMRRLLVARLDDLPAGARRTLQTASVLGREVDVGILRDMLDSTDLDQHIQLAVDAEIWDRTAENRVTFSNLLLRDAAYGMLLHADARKLHQAAALAIENTSEPADRKDAELAYHYDRAGNPERAVDYYLDAGRIAADRYANQEAHAHLNRAIELLPLDDHPRRYAALRLKHDLYDLDGNRSSQEETIELLERLGEIDPTYSIEATLLRARLLIALGRYDDAEEIIVDAADSPDPKTTEVEGSLMLIRARIARYQGRIQDALILAQNARELFVECGDDIRVATTDDFVGGIAWETGDFETAAERHRNAAEVFRSAGRVTDEIRALNNLGTAIISIGDYSAARHIHQEGVSRSRSIGYRMGEGDHLDNIGGTAWAVGDFDLALQYYGDSLQIRKGMADEWGIAISKGNLGGTHRAMGNLEQALELYREALEVDRAIGRRRGEAFDLHGIGLCHLDLGRYNLATESLERATEIRQDLGETHLANESRIACAVAMLRRGEPGQAFELVDMALEGEGDDFFAGAIETTATRLRCIEVLDAVSPEAADSLRERTRQGVLERAERISDPAHRQSYLERVESHLQATTDHHTGTTAFEAE